MSGVADQKSTKQPLFQSLVMFYTEYEINMNTISSLARQGGW